MTYSNLEQMLELTGFVLIGVNSWLNATLAETIMTNHLKSSLKIKVTTLIVLNVRSIHWHPIVKHVNVKSLVMD